MLYCNRRENLCRKTIPQTSYSYNYLISKFPWAQRANLLAPGAAGLKSSFCSKYCLIFALSYKVYINNLTYRVMCWLKSMRT